MFSKKSNMQVGINIAVGLLSTNNIILPSSMCAAVTSGLSVYRTFGNGF